MKKAVSVLFALALCATTATTALAATVDQDSGDSLGSTLTYTHTNDPAYTITIPAQIVLEKEGTVVDIVASDVKDLGDQSISVTVAGTNYYRNQFVLSADTRPSSYVRFSLTLENGDVLETTGGKDEHVGKELANFTDDGTKSYTVTPVLLDNTVAGADYTGTLTYGIALV